MMDSPDQILKDFRSIECFECEEHFGYEFRTERHVRFCSDKCIKSFNAKRRSQSVPRFNRYASCVSLPNFHNCNEKSTKTVLQPASPAESLESTSLIVVCSNENPSETLPGPATTSNDLASAAPIPKSVPVLIQPQNQDTTPEVVASKISVSTEPQPEPLKPTFPSAVPELSKKEIISENRRVRFEDLKHSQHILCNVMGFRVAFMWDNLELTLNAFEDEENMENMQEEVQAYCATAPPLERVPEDGEIVFSNYHGDFYRAVVVSKGDMKADSVNVNFIDYGDSSKELLSSCREPDPRIMQKHPLYGLGFILLLESEKAKLMKKSDLPDYFWDWLEAQKFCAQPEGGIQSTPNSRKWVGELYMGMKMREGTLSDIIEDVEYLLPIPDSEESFTSGSANLTDVKNNPQHVSPQSTKIVEDLVTLPSPAMISCTKPKQATHNLVKSGKASNSETIPKPTIDAPAAKTYVGQNSGNKVTDAQASIQAKDPLVQAPTVLPSTIPSETNTELTAPKNSVTTLYIRSSSSAEKISEFVSQKNYAEDYSYKFHMSSAKWSRSFKHGQKVFVSFLWNPGKITVNSAAEKDMKELEALCTKVSSWCEHAPNLATVPSVHDIILAPYNEAFYRAVVQAIKGDELTVDFLDYGDATEVEFSKCKPLSPEIAQVPIQGLLLTMEGVPDDTSGVPDTLMNSATVAELQLEKVKEVNAGHWVARLWIDTETHWAGVIVTYLLQKKYQKTL